MSSPEQVGVIRERPAPSLSGGVVWYTVSFGPGRARKHPEDELEAFEADSNDVPDMLLQGRFGGRDAFSKLVTHLKLSISLRSQIYALDASRTDFLPYQFKPLLKFLESRSHRLLIADEVGLGKTIEAGLILTEMRQRRPLERVLIVPPSHLMPKWKEELRRRFDLDFEIFRAANFLEYLNQYEQEGEGADLRAILSLQSLRSRRIQARLQEVSPTFDLVVFDEAGRLRNEDTLSHHAARQVVETADGALLLTATPVQTKNTDLFNLLRLLEPEEFQRIEVFQQQVEANRHVLNALSLLARGASAAECLDVLTHVEATHLAERFLANPLYQEVGDRLRRASSLSVRERVELQRDVTSLNALGHVLSRTRKREVQVGQPIRRAQVVSVSPDVVEGEFYERVTRVCRTAYMQSHGDLVAAFAATMPQRQMASSMVAMIDYVTERLHTPEGEAETAELSDLEPEEADAPDAESARSHVQWAELGDLREWRTKLVAVDTKWRAFADAVQNLEAEDPQAKIVVFAFFKRTLRYLENRLREIGVGCVRLDGDVKSVPDDPEADERGKRLRRFRDDRGVRVLLSSEVGDEGVDLQFARVLVNYDLPWNPMKVEQRIGRLDRIGQKSKAITIVNLSMQGTIEDKILARLYSRIGLFRESVGDLETILGEEIRKLEKDLFSAQLTPREEEQRIEQAAAAIEKQRDDVVRFEQAARSLIGSDEFFIEEIERARARGRYVSGSELLIYVRDFVEAHHRRCTLKPADKDGIFLLNVTSDFSDFVRRHVPPGDYGLRMLLRRAAGGVVRLTTERTVAQDDPSLEFLTFHHPLIRAIKKHYDENEQEIHPVSYVAVSTGNVHTGEYVWFLYETEISGARPVKDIEVVAFSLADGRELSPDDCEVLLGAMLTGARSIPPTQRSAQVTTELCRRAEDSLVARLEGRFTERKRYNDALVANRAASIRETWERNIRHRREQLERARELGRKDTYIRGLETGLANLKVAFERKLHEVERGRVLGKSQKVRGAGIVEVRADA